MSMETDSTPLTPHGATPSPSSASSPSRAGAPPLPPRLFLHFSFKTDPLQHLSGAVDRLTLTSACSVDTANLPDLISATTLRSLVQTMPHEEESPLKRGLEKLSKEDQDRYRLACAGNIPITHWVFEVLAEAVIGDDPEANSNFESLAESNRMRNTDGSVETNWKNVLDTLLIKSGKDKHEIS